MLIAAPCRPSSSEIGTAPNTSTKASPPLAWRLPESSVRFGTVIESREDSRLASSDLSLMIRAYFARCIVTTWCSTDWTNVTSWLERGARTAKSRSDT